jgi:glycosyltransferase involved in cell wall biosynthesis
MTPAGSRTGPLRLIDLPAVDSTRRGWPWTEEALIPPQASQSTWPQLTIVTPSFNQGAFIEETIRSVLLQGYSNLEYLVLDGGSTDGTIEILKKYDRWIDFWVSARDGGQTQAINRGFARATGDWVAWQNSDDVYLPGTFVRLADAVAADASADVYYGDKDYVDEDGKFLFTATARDPHVLENMIPWPCVNSEVAFFRRTLFAAGGFALNEARRHYMDYELFLDLLFAGKRFQHVPGVRSTFRQHREAKSSRQADIAQAEEFELHQRIYRQPGIPPAARHKAFDALVNDCRNDYGHYRFGRLRRHVAALRQMAVAPDVVPADLTWKTVASMAGPTVVRVTKSIGRAFRPTVTSNA